MTENEKRTGQSKKAMFGPLHPGLSTTHTCTYDWFTVKHTCALRCDIYVHDQLHYNICTGVHYPRDIISLYCLSLIAVFIASRSLNVPPTLVRAFWYIMFETTRVHYVIFAAWKLSAPLPGCDVIARTNRHVQNFSCWLVFQKNVTLRAQTNGYFLYYMYIKGK